MARTARPPPFERDPPCRQSPAPDAPRESETGRDTQAFFAKEVSRLMDRLYGTALRLTRNGADAEELVAESVAKAWEALPGLRDRRAFAGWMLRILTNTFVSDWRRRRADPPLEASDGVADGAGGDADADAQEFSLFRRLHQPFLLWWGTPEHAFLNKLLREDLESAVDGLPQPYRVVLVLVEIEGWSYAEAAEALALPIGTVRSRLARARGRLQHALWEQGRDAGLVAGSAPGATRGATPGGGDAP